MIMVMGKLLLNKEFEWDSDGLFLSSDPVLCPAIRIERECVKKAAR